MSTLVDALAATGGIDRIVGRPNTASLIIETSESAKALTARLVDAGLLRVAPAPKPPPVRDVARLGLLNADQALSRRTEGALDMRTAFALALAMAALYQLARGRLFGPALSMALGAASMLGAADETAAEVSAGGEAD